MALDRALTPAEVENLEKNGCRSDHWGGVRVAEGFDPSRVTDTEFCGEIRIGRLTGDLDTGDGIKKKTGIYRARLSNVSVGDQCRIASVNGWLSNLAIESGVCIEDAGTIACTEETTFGNGHAISVYNEGGGRELKITRETSAPIAYWSVLYRNRGGLVAKLDALAEKYAESAKSRTALIGKGSRILQCGVITNVWIGPSARLTGVASLKNGSVDSSPEAPTQVGSGVIAEDFIFQKGCSVKDGAMIFASLVGEGTRIGKQFSAENSVFFANCEGFHSETCSVFAGPYSVTHHRSTLLIAALCSFYNAGSGTNQSNHMYKLGPVHQGILERGCKTGSFSYLLWPSRVGAFTAVIGKHYANFDTSDFPFSYINEEDGKSVLVPGMNFFTVGTMRDAEKWPARDRRKNKRKLDPIVFDVLSPYTGQKMIRGSAILADLLEKTEKSQTYAAYNGIQIKRLLLKTCRRYYGLALDKYFGDVIAERLLAKQNKTEAFRRESEYGDGEWVDLCGLLCSQARAEALCAKIEKGEVSTLEKLHEELGAIQSAYKTDEWTWILANYKKVYGRDLADESSEQVRAFLESWKEASLKLLHMVENDASKEFEGITRTGFGIDGGRDEDFEAVRGTALTNKFVNKLKSDMSGVESRFQAAVARIHS